MRKTLNKEYLESKGFKKVSLFNHPEETYYKYQNDIMMYITFWGVRISNFEITSQEDLDNLQIAYNNLVVIRKEALEDE